MTDYKQLAKDRTEFADEYIKMFIENLNNKDFTFAIHALINAERQLSDAYCACLHFDYAFSKEYSNCVNQYEETRRRLTKAEDDFINTIIEVKYGK